MEKVGVDPETGEFDADVIETGTSKSQRDRLATIQGIIDDLSDYEQGAPLDEIIEAAGGVGIEEDKARQALSKLSRQGDVYEPATDCYRNV